jgi:hypothetical protein
MKSEVVAVALVVLIAASLGIGYLAGSGARSTQTGASSSSASTSGVQTNSTKSSQSSTTMSTSSTGQLAGNASTVYSNGLRLSLSMNATRISAGQDLQVNVSLFNTLPKVNSVPTSNDWPFLGIPVALWPPCFYASPSSTVAEAVVVVLPGYYTLANISSAANVQFGIRCMEGVDVDHVVFQPSSSQANVTGIYDVVSQNDTLGPYNLMANFTTRGYWDLLNNSRQVNPPVLGDQEPPLSPTATVFVPGVYTVAVADEWGEAVILHLMVSYPPIISPPQHPTGY